MRPYLLAAVDAVLAEDGRAARGNPHAGQRVAVNLVLLDHALALLVLGHAKRKKKRIGRQSHPGGQTRPMPSAVSLARRPLTT